MAIPTSNDSDSKPPEASKEPGTPGPQGSREAGAELKLVADASAQTPGETTRRGLPIWLFVLVFVLFSGTLFWQVRVARDLEAQVTALEQQLAATRSLLGAHRSRLAEIRAGVHDLAGRLTNLQALVDADPGKGQNARAAALGRGSRADGSRTAPDTSLGEDSRPIPPRLPQD